MSGKGYKCPECGEMFDCWESLAGHSQAHGGFNARACLDGRVLEPEKVEKLYWEDEMTQREIGEELGVDRAKIRKIMEEEDICKRSFGETQKLRFSKIDNPKNEKLRKEVNFDKGAELAYILGVIKGDGWYDSTGKYNRIVLDSIHREFIMSFKESLQEIGLNPHTKKKEDDRFKQGFHFILSCASINFCKWCSNVQIQEYVLGHASREKEFVRGVYESEGSLGPYGKENNYRLSIRCGDKSLIQFVSKLLERMNINHTKSVERRQKRKNMHTICVSRQGEIIEFIDRINPVIRNDKSDIIFGPYCRWTDKEIEILKKEYPKKGPEISILLDNGRSISAIQRKASYLGVGYNE